jgi:sulfatase maturation enzyme AslB (radical SAM superfamily)
MTPVTKLSDMKNWKDDPGYTVVRNKMLKGQKIPNCTACYDQEAVGENVSIRRHETIEWAALLHLKSINELKDITSPSYFELRFSNKCNITCRSCSGHFSHLIQKENDQIKDEKFQTIVDKQAFSSTGGDELIQWDNIKRVYIGGGESTVQPELYRFMRKCISNDNTDFEFRIGTNGVRISDKLFDLFKHFKNLTFSLSIDGTPKVDEYIRWGTEANDKYSNMQRLKNQGHPIALNFVMSIWNISHIGEILQYFDKAYPGSPVHMNKAGYNGDIISPFLFPDKDVVKESIAKAKKTQVYFSNEQRTKFLIDSVDKFYSSDKSVDFEKLKKFFYYNDTLDRVRGVALKDYIPELERCRKFVT